jgi:antitoxin HicB
VDYPVTLERDDNRTVLVHFPDFPEAHTFGEDEADALQRAKDALATVIDAYIRDRRDIPKPSSRPSRLRVAVPALIEVKIQLYDAMRSNNIGKAELARRLGWHLPQVDRLLEMRHGSRLAQLEAAFEALGKRLIVGIEELSAASPQRASRRRITRRRAPHVTAADRKRSQRQSK